MSQPRRRRTAKRSTWAELNDLAGTFRWLVAAVAVSLMLIIVFSNPVTGTLFVVASIAVVVLLVRRRLHRNEQTWHRTWIRTSNAQTVADLISLSPVQFERLVADRMQDRGYRDIKRVGGPGDHGVDIFALNEHGARVVVQCKKYDTAKVGPAAVRELGGALVMHSADKAVLVTTSALTEQAAETARRLGITVIDRSTVLTWLGL